MPLGIELLARCSRLPNRMRRGLWGGKKLNFKNKVTEYEKKLRIMRKPNVVTAALYSEALGKTLRLPVTTSLLRRIDHLGGLDNYLLQTPDSRLHSDIGSELKFKVGLLHKQRQHEEWVAQRAELEAARRQTADAMLLQGQSSSGTAPAEGHARAESGSS